ncbi:MAG TPA: hypothetical protein VHR35_00015, partial [Nocardioides sp.]|nr:hypothetical protein [Nocardioides sp.]
MNRFVSLTSRLVATAVLLVAVVAALIAGAATIALHSYLSSRLDRDVMASLPQLPHEGRAAVAPDDADEDNRPPFDVRRYGTLTGIIGTTAPWAMIDDEHGYRYLDASTIATLADV